MSTSQSLLYGAGLLLSFAVGALVVTAWHGRELEQLPRQTTVHIPSRGPAQSQQELEQQVAGLEAEVQLLTEKLQEAASRAASQARGPASDLQHAVALRALTGIRLEDDPTREQAEAYVRRIMQVVKSQNSYSSSDPHIAMLALVGPEHLEVLLAQRDQFYIPFAVALVATEEQKPLVIAALAENPDLVTAIEKLGWQEDARETLIEGLRKGSDYLPIEWINMVARFEDPATYPLLRHYLAVGMNPDWTYKAVSKLDVDLDTWVATAWRQQKARVAWNSLLPGDGRHWIGLEPAAARHGQTDALARLFDVLRKNNGEEWESRAATTAIAELTDAKGTDAEKVTWFDRVKDDLVWDPELRRYIVRPTTLPSSQRSSPSR